MTDFPTWTGPEAVRRLNAELAKDGFFLLEREAEKCSEVRALQQLMVDLNMPEPVDEAEALWGVISKALGDFRESPSVRTANIVAIIREALAKARGERT